MNPELKTKKRTRIAICTIIAIVYFILIRFFVGLALVSGPSMAPCLKHGDIVVVQKKGFDLSNGIIVITNSNNPYKTAIIKRVIASGGQRIEITEERIFVDGSPVVEDFSDARFLNPLSLTVPENHVFLLGDNMGESRDSRDIGCVFAGDITGKAVFRLFPFSPVYTRH